MNHVFLWFNSRGDSARWGGSAFVAITAGMFLTKDNIHSPIHRRFICKGDTHTHRELIRGWLWEPKHSQTVHNTKGTRAHTHRELIRTWLWEPKGSSLDIHTVYFTETLEAQPSHWCTRKQYSIRN